MDVPEPDRDLGHSATQMRALLGEEDFSRLLAYTFHKTSAIDVDGEHVFYDVDVRMFLSLHARHAARDTICPTPPGGGTWGPPGQG